MIPHLEKLNAAQNLSRQQASELAHYLVSIEADDDTKRILQLLHDKGETAEEVAAFADVMEQHMCHLSTDRPCVDIVGTGGDGADTVNISTAASFVVASCGVDVVKHGNRSSSSRCGSADFIESSGIPLDCEIVSVEKCLKDTHYAFCFAPTFHPSFLKFKNIRKQLNIRTIFNLLGPLLNPANVPFIVLGVYKKELLNVYAHALQQRGIKRALVVYGSGLDELNCLGVNDAVLVSPTELTEMTIDPKQFGFEYCQLTDLQGGDAEANKKILEAVLKGQTKGPIAETIALNGGAALYVAGVCESLSQGVERAMQAMSTGKAFEKMIEVRNYLTAGDL